MPVLLALQLPWEAKVAHTHIDRYSSPMNFSPRYQGRRRPLKSLCSPASVDSLCLPLHGSGPWRNPCYNLMGQVKPYVQGHVHIREIKHNVMTSYAIPAGLWLKVSAKRAPPCGSMNVTPLYWWRDFLLWKLSNEMETTVTLLNINQMTVLLLIQMIVLLLISLSVLFYLVKGQLCWVLRL